MWDGGVMGNLVIYTTLHSIHKVVKCKRLQEIHVTSVQKQEIRTKL